MDSRIQIRFFLKYGSSSLQSVSETIILEKQNVANP